MNTLEFSKMHGLSNDFMVINTIHHTVPLIPETIVKWANRHTGVGFDQLIVITEPSDTTVDFGYRIFNTDGSEAEQCGNGVRCAALYIHEKKMSSKQTLRLATPFVTVTCELHGNNQVTVNMGKADFSPGSLPWTGSPDLAYHLMFNDTLLRFGAVSLPNPHVILNFQDIEQLDVTAIGCFFNQHESFPRGTNVGFMQLITNTHIKLRVYERGVGETRSCGTNACAAVVIGQLWGLLTNKVKVDLLGGELLIESTAEKEIRMTGPALTVFEGNILL